MIIAFPFPIFSKKNGQSIIVKKCEIYSISSVVYKVTEIVMNPFSDLKYGRS